MVLLAGNEAELLRHSQNAVIPIIFRDFPFMSGFYYPMQKSPGSGCTGELNVVLE
jgi:hypothetical protein